MRGLLHGVALCFAMFRSVSHCGAPHYALLVSIAVRFNLMLRSLVSSRHKFVHLLLQVARAQTPSVYNESESPVSTYSQPFIHTSQQKATSSWPIRKNTIRSTTLDANGPAANFHLEIQVNWWVLWFWFHCRTWTATFVTLPARKNVIRHAIKNSKCHKICPEGNWKIPDRVPPDRTERMSERVSEDDGWKDRISDDMLDGELREDFLDVRKNVRKNVRKICQMDIADMHRWNARRYAR